MQVIIIKNYFNINNNNFVSKKTFYLGCEANKLFM